jgi:Ca2+-binding RTX toxin-like protein
LFTPNDDSVSLGDGPNDGDALAGDDIVYGNAGADSIIGNVGADEIYGNQGVDEVYGNQGDDLVFGGQENDDLFGGQGGDRIYGNLGDDRIYGNLGNDTLFGGEGDDEFAFLSGDGQDTVADFGDGDTISLRTDINDTGVQSFADLTITENENGDAVIDLGGDNSLTVDGVSPDELSESDFSFF